MAAGFCSFIPLSLPSLSRIQKAKALRPTSGLGDLGLSLLPRPVLIFFFLVFHFLLGVADSNLIGAFYSADNLGLQGKRQNQPRWVSTNRL